MSSDEAVIGTNDDAVHSKYSAVEAGYLDDPYVHCFVKRSSGLSPRAPLINRGTFTRTWIIDQIIAKFATQDCQVVSFGAGSDTRPFRMWPVLLLNQNQNIKRFIEIDLPQVTSKKAFSIAKSKSILKLFGQKPAITKGGSQLSSDRYSLIPGDLREWSQVWAELEPQLLPIPTIFVSECCFIYLDPDVVDRIISNVCRTGIFITYEQILPSTAFGRMMTMNLSNRGIYLPGFERYPTLDAQMQRYTLNGYTTSESIDFNQVWELVPLFEKDRITKLEWMDELEEWIMISSQYCITTSRKQ